MAAENLLALPRDVASVSPVTNNGQHVGVVELATVRYVFKGVRETSNRGRPILGGRS
jgi:hypothetical protein